MAALLFDIGNVLLTFDFRHAASRMAERSKLKQEEIMKAITPFKNPLESGQMPDAEFLYRATEAIDFQGSTAEFRDLWCDIFALNDPMAKTLAALPRQVPAYLFSNTNGLHLDWMQSRYGIFKHFQGGIYSHLAKAMKPHPGMYEQAIATYGLDPASTFYVDDLLPNIQTGQALGFVCHLYDPTNHAALHTELNTWLANTP